MIVGDGRLAQQDFEWLASLHRKNLGNSIVSKLGERILLRYYRFIEQSDSDFLFVEGQPGEIQGAAVLSLDSRAVMHRFVRSNLLAFAVASLRKCLVSPSFAMSLLAQRSPEAASVYGDAEQQVEIVQIFVNEKYRNKHIGKKILAQVNDFLSSRNINEYMIRTRVNNNEATLGFYERNSFVEIKRPSGKGDTFVS